MKWVKPPIEAEAVRALATSHNLDLLTASILTRRGTVEPGQIAFFLEEDERFLHNPFLFSDMETAVDRVLAAAEEGEKVLVCGDKDADGITATVLMVETLRMVGLDPQWRVPLGDEDYGLNPEVLKEKAAEDVTLVISVDCGISDFAEISLAGDLGMDVLVFDHHMPREEGLPDALAIVNPKVGRSYPFTGLCAVAVVSKFQWALSLAGTDLWGEEFCLILARADRPSQDSSPVGASVDESSNGADSEKPDSSGLVLEAVRMRNLLEQERIVVEGGSGEVGRDRLLRFIEGSPLLTFGRNEQVPLISAFFGGAEVHVIDTAEQIYREAPGLRGRSLTDLENSSRMARYFPGNRGALTTLKNLLISLQYRSVSPAFDNWRRGLDLVALGTLADLMPLEDENRILVRMGLNRLNNSDSVTGRRSSIRELLIRQRLHEGRLGTTEAAWQICPLINASGRMGQADVGVALFLEDDPSRISSAADELVALNKKRRTLGENLWEKLRPRAYESLEDLGGRMLIVSDAEAPRGITGILATRLQKALDAAAVVISLQGNKASGSIRCDTGMNALNWLEAMSPVFEDFGGHPQAGGFRMEASKLDELRTRTLSWLRSSSPGDVEKEEITIDAELSHEQFARLGAGGLENLLESLEPYGEGFRPLTFLTRGVRILQADLVGKPKNNHLKLQVSLGENRWPALWWDGAERYGTLIRKDSEVDLVYRVDRDQWRGANARRLTVLEASACET